MTDQYLDSVKKQFLFYKTLGERAIAQVPAEKLAWQYNEESNSIATIIKHLSGNMLSRWTAFLTTDGEKEWRDRDSEFENGTEDKEELMKKWETGWKCFFDSFEALTVEDLDKEIFIRNMGLRVVDAINRQLAHYPYHIGQIIFISKMVCGQPWQSLSIPKGSSTEFNAAKFAKSKHTESFIDEFMGGNK